jgi:hypothetical protein
MRLLLPTLMIAILPASISAQQSQALGVDVQVGEIRKLTVAAGPGAEVIASGFAERDDAVVLRVTANVEWRVEVAAADAALEVRPNSDGAYAPVSAAWQAVAAGGRGRDQEIVLDLRRTGDVAPDAGDLLVRIVRL